MPLIEIILVAALLMSTLIQLYFWGILFNYLASYKHPVKSSEHPDKCEIGVSVIICARNEAKNLKKYLPRLLNQSYHNLEIIVINDASTDNSLEILLEFQKKSHILRVLQINSKYTVGKKAALSYGISAAHKEAILLTDADCTPIGKHWVSEMISGLKPGKEIVLGFSPYLTTSSLLNRFIRFETNYIATQYYSFALAGIPYMGVGRNLLYRRQLFFDNGGFKDHMHLASGDDDLLINKAARFSNTSVVLTPQAFMYSVPKSYWRDFYYQKRRHLTAGQHYQTKHKVLLGLLSASHAGHYLSVISLMIMFPAQRPLALFATTVRILVVCWQYRRILSLLRDTSLLPWVPLLDVAYLLYYLVFAPVLFNTGKSRQEKWKQ
ncbi:MAG: glycosyltransferase [Saprospiraceae bacterium]|nr:glycosyltransferase [Saprospiraceae bacterium]